MDLSKPLIVLAKTKTGIRTIPAGKWGIDRYTPVGEDAQLYERMPYGGKRFIKWSDVVLS